MANGTGLRDVARPRSGVVQGTVVSTTAGPVPTVMDLCLTHVTRLRNEHRPSARPTEAAFLRYIAPTALASTPACYATADQFRIILRDIVLAGHVATARRLRSHLHAAFAQANPISQLPIPALSDRTWIPELSQSDFAAFWHHLQVGPDAEWTMAHRLMRLSILLFGQGCKSLLSVQVEHVNLEHGHVLQLVGPRDRALPRKHRLSVGEAAAAELSWLVEGAGKLPTSSLFPGRSPRACLHPGSVSRFLHLASAELLRQGKVRRLFNYRDVRQTIDTLGASLGINRELRARLQGLVVREPSWSVHYDFINEKREALVRWETFLESLLPPDSR